MKNILMMSHYYNPHRGGVEKHLEKLIGKLIKKDYRVKLITFKHHPDLPSIEKISENFTLYRIPYKRVKYIGLLMIWLWIFKNFRLFYQSEIVHIHDVFIWYFPLRLFFLFKPTFITFHGYESYPLKNHYIILRRLASKMTNGNICVGKFISKWYGIEPTIVTYGATTISKSKHNYNFIYDAVFIGRLDQQTGILTYTKAVELFKKNHRDFKLLVLGEGEYKKDIENKFYCKGYVKNPGSYLLKSRIAFVSRYLSILEAFEKKKLVFAVYDNPLKRDYLRLTPFYSYIIMAKDTHDLINKINDYYKFSKKYKKNINHAYKWVLNQTWDKMLNDYENLWFPRK